ncbi:MAG: alpha/beta hydrolase [Sphingobacteriales bacterium]|nr:MAG: alpha/beta hydrolase [Sphingobacteriales bacterium]
MICIRTERFPNLCYRKTGNGPAFVLVHGFPENGDLWRKVVPALSESFTVIVPDLPGAGESTFTGDLSIEDMADSLNLILENEGIDKAVVAGHSMGGYTAFAFAERFKDKLAGLSLVHSTASADDEEKKETRRKSIALIEKGGKDAFIRQMTPNLFSKKFKEEYPEVIEQQVKRGLQLPAESIIAFYKAMINRPERVSILSSANYPVQWIVGKEDTIAPPEKIAEQSKLSDRTFVSVYPDVSHMSMLEDEKKLIEDLKKFTSYCFGN